MTLTDKMRERMASVGATITKEEFTSGAVEGDGMKWIEGFLRIGLRRYRELYPKSRVSDREVFQALMESLTEATGAIEKSSDGKFIIPAKVL